MMKYLFAITCAALVLFSCADEPETTDASSGVSGQSADAERIEALEVELDAMRSESSAKDSALMESAKAFEEIANNLAQMSYKQGRIRSQSMNPELNEDPKQYIMEEIAEINKLREANASAMAGLNRKLKASLANNESLRAVVESLNNQILIQEGEIASLQGQLETLDKEYAEMFDAYIEVSELAENLEIELNKGYYAYGTKRELKDNGVITKEGSIIGLGGAKKLKDDFNKEYFEEIDISQTNEIIIVGKKPDVITTHPASSYTLEKGDGSNVIKITDAKAFWSASKYLVVVVQ